MEGILVKSKYVFLGTTKLGILDQHAELDFYKASSLKQQSIQTYYPNSEPTSLCPYSLMLHG